MRSGSVVRDPSTSRPVELRVVPPVGGEPIEPKASVLMENGLAQSDLAQRNLAQRIRELPTASVLMGLTVLLCLIGVVMVGSASTVVSMNLYGSPYALLIRELMWMSLGGIAMFLACRLDYRKWRRLRIPLLIGTMLMLGAVLVAGHSSDGASRWLGFGQLRLQPSELMKLALALFCADLVARRGQRRTRTRAVVVPVVLVAGASAVLILMQPDMGTALVIAAMALALLFGSGLPMRPLLKFIALLAGLAFVVGLLDPYRRARLLAFINPGAHRSGSGYQVLQSLIGLGSGHLTGLGLGAGQEKWGFLPNAHTDFIFSVVGEELGLIGALAVLGLLGALVWFGLRAASRAPDRFGSLLAIALVAWLASEAVINIGAVVGLLPVTGIPLPFVSFGGSSLVITMMAAGLLVNIARQERRPRQLPSVLPPKSDERRRQMPGPKRQPAPSST